ESPAELRNRIKKKIADDQGWDVLFFAGHSNETELTGGEIAIAPMVSLSISEIEQEILIAKQRGLQFALFNSCSGISIATSLINLGLSQVAIMREPIHNQVAQSFLIKFLENLANYQDVHESLIAATYALKEQSNYSSAYLVPSLFYHPQAVLFQIQPRGIKETLRKLLPTRYEAIALSSFLFLSLIPQLQYLLLDSRIWLQAIYRDVTHQIPVATSPPVLLVGIDEKSIREFPLKSLNPIDRNYLAQLVNKSITSAKVVGIDYLLDYQQKEHNNDFILGKSIRDGVNKGIYFVFASQELEGKQIGVGEQTNIADLNWSLQGDISSFDWYLEQPVSANSCLVKCPFSYLLSVAYGLNKQPVTSSLPQPNLANKQNLNTQIIKYIHQSNQPNNILKFLSSKPSHLAPITDFSHQFNQTWLQPLTDFSIPINQAYEFIPAWKFLKLSYSDIQRLKLEQRVVLIAPGGYQYAGVTKYDEDNFTVPMAINYWRSRLKNAPPNSEVLTEAEDQILENTPPNSEVLTGAEVHGYSIHHFLNQHLVRHIPDLWMVGLAALLGKVTVLIYQQNKERKQWVVGLAIGTASYGIISLQVYISAAVLIPWLLPSAVFWIYIFRNEKK
ncbi:MAG: CHASE2 domain-containing protein, partial [Crinalium sp.]